jgi:hypothetical protein
MLDTSKTLFILCSNSLTILVFYSKVASRGIEFILDKAYEYRIDFIYSKFMSIVLVFLANAAFFGLQVYFSMTILLGTMERKYQTAI